MSPAVSSAADVCTLWLCCASTAHFQSWRLFEQGVGRDKGNPVVAHPFRGWELSPRKPLVQKPPFLSKARGKLFYLCLHQRIEAWCLSEQLLYLIIKEYFQAKRMSGGSSMQTLTLVACAIWILASVDAVIAMCDQTVCSYTTGAFITAQVGYQVFFALSLVSSSAPLGVCSNTAGTSWGVSLVVKRASKSIPPCWLHGRWPCLTDKWRHWQVRQVFCTKPVWFLLQKPVLRASSLGC